MWIVRGDESPTRTCEIDRARGRAKETGRASQVVLEGFWSFIIWRFAGQPGPNIRVFAVLRMVRFLKPMRQMPVFREMRLLVDSLLGSMHMILVSIFVVFMFIYAYERPASKACLRRAARATAGDARTPAADARTRGRPGEQGRADAPGRPREKSQVRGLREHVLEQQARLSLHAVALFSISVG